VKVCPVCGTEYGEDAAFCSRDRSPLRPAAAGAAHGLVGQLLGDRYHIESRIGEGGMGEVYLATHVLMGRRCALKVMSQALSRDPDAVTRFNREATNASRISHPNVCAIYDFGLTPDGLVYLAMEFVDGRTLTALAEERGPMPVTAAVDLMTQCAAGLEAAHDLGIVHRDLKPDNIMVISRPDRDTVKLVDFGIAKAIAGDQGQRVTKTGFVVGTPEYMSPEQLAGDPIDGRSDQYSLALVFYRLITGQLPFEGTSIQETLVKRLTDPPRPLALARPEGKFPAGLQGVMDRALARQPAQRYPSVVAFVDALREVAPGDAAPTRRLAAPGQSAAASIPSTRRVPEAADRRRSRMAWAAAGLAVAALGTWGVVQMTGAPAVSPPPVTPLTADSGKPAAVSPAPVPLPPPPAPPAAQPGSAAHGTKLAVADTQAVLAGVADTLVLPEADFDSVDRRPRALRLARLILESRRQPPSRRALMAFYLAEEALRNRDIAEAHRLYTRAYALDPLPRYSTMMEQTRRDTTAT
jgi:eukaryotic-like serine/threonine-protein kinase